ncbi:MAG: FdtA/QdtA family cupin domain-containing protein [Bacteroidia bacterium]|nr:FdtA/QdtA family cupin domain-containing protein [Bacteroidia bacterium]
MEQHQFEMPHLIKFNKWGESAIGYISVTQNNELPFIVKRVFWTYYTPESIVRGRHAHFKTEQILIAVSGRIIVNTENASGKINQFVLESPDVGVYLPPNVWHTMQYSHAAVQMVLASTDFNENDYIRNHNEFKKIWGS